MSVLEGEANTSSTPTRRRILHALAGVAAGAILTLVLFLPITAAVERIQPIEFRTWEDAFSLSAPLLPGFLVLGAAGSIAWRRRRLRTVAYGAIGGMLLVYLIALATFARDPLGFRAGSGSPGAQSSLEHSLPSPWAPSGEFIPMTKFTAQELNKMGQGRELRPLRFVPADVPSRDPDIVSVNPIDDYTWGAAALSDQTGLCYLILRMHDRQNPRNGNTFYGVLARGSPCLGAAARPTNVHGDDWP